LVRGKDGGRGAWLRTRFGYFPNSLSPNVGGVGEVLLEVSVGLARGGAIALKGITEQNEQSKKICSDVTW